MALMTACARQDAAQPATQPSSTRAIAEQWIGRWAGPEGTYLDIALTGETWRLTIANLDGPRTFAGLADGAGLAFERDGVRETIRATDGQATGMKWLADKTNCLTVKPGEGYCRDQ